MCTGVRWFTLAGLVSPPAIFSRASGSAGAEGDEGSGALKNGSWALELPWTLAPGHWAFISPCSDKRVDSVLGPDAGFLMAPSEDGRTQMNVPSASAEFFQACPVGANGRTGSGIDQADLLQGPVHAAEIAGGAGDHDVVQAVVAATRMRQQVIILKPHRLKGRVLVDVLRAPGQGFWIGLLDSLPDFFSDQRDAAEAAVKAVALMQALLFGGGGHAQVHPLLFGEAGRRVFDGSIADMGAVAAPEGFGPFADRR